MCCKVNSVDKTEIGIPDELKVKKGSYEAICNPILQAQLLDEQKTDLDVIVGLCVGPRSLSIKHSDAPVTTLITKDRVLGHNPAAALYTSNSITSGSCSRGKNYDKQRSLIYGQIREHFAGNRAHAARSASPDRRRRGVADLC